MTEATKLPDVSDAEMKQFCAAIGELILWANLLDRQLNGALIAMMALPQRAMIEPIVAQLNPRQKTDLLKSRAKKLRRPDWKNGVIKWIERVEKVNAKRNVVAHHGIYIADGKINLFSAQLSKIISSLENAGSTLRPGKPMGLSDILKWIEEAKAAYVEGNEVVRRMDSALANLDVKGKK